MHRVMGFSSLAPKVNSCAQASVPRRLVNLQTGSGSVVWGKLELAQPFLVIWAGSSRLKTPCCYCLGASKLFTWIFFFSHLYWSIIALQWCVSFCCITKWISKIYKQFTWIFKCRALPGEDHSKALLSGVLCQVGSNPSLRGLWLLLAFLSKVPLIRPEIIEGPGHCCEAALAKR